MWRSILIRRLRRPRPGLTGLAGVLCGLMLALVLPGRAEAAFGDCADRNYMAGFDERYRDADFLCVERLNVAVPSATSATGEGPPRIRIIQDISADWAADEGRMADYQRGVQAAIDMLGRMGPYRMHDVTILFADDFAPRRDAERFSGIAGFTYMDPPKSDECQIVFFLLGAGATHERGAAVVAHEIFHCVQKANLSPGQMTSMTEAGDGGAWWIEGSAAWFASAALPEADAYLQRHLDTFDASSPETPLFRMRYAAAPFFFWLAGDRGEDRMLSFLSGMADRIDERAQITAMREALPGDDWLRFAQDYLDRRIPGPRGTLPMTPQDGATWSWTTARTERIPLEPFVLARGWIDCDCGDWSTDTRPDVPHAARPAAGGDWADLPGRIAVPSGEHERFRFAGFNTGGRPATLEIEARQEAACAECAAIRTVDACLVGTWRQTGGGPVEWMRRHMPAGASIPSAERSGDVFTLNHDGSFTTGTFRASATILMEHADGTAEGQGRLAAQAGGYWSAADGWLNLCPREQSLAGQARVTLPAGGTRTTPIGPGRPVQSTQTYSCDETSLITWMDMPGSDPMETSYTRVASGG
ncbi:hypothetical protein [Caulobacter sp. 17J65-9]|uniref:hypothetical protein n=1 Tax=Caulobacter sp. 17J65-9 TaxID=2709382 RepID=UPI0013C917A9|nr:hypothetical protein [Caulobacter sp. 17J65-9]NEX91469.1 hypothetical protein [Caulobacter sp. 17J65-9]